MPAIAARSKIAVLIFLCGDRAHGALLQVVLSCLGRTLVGAGPVFRTERYSTGIRYIF